MSDGRCATCKHFEQPFTRRTEWGHCGRAGSNDGEADDRSFPATAHDVESYRAWLSVRSDFGCVLHAPAAGTSQ